MLACAGIAFLSLLLTSPASAQPTLRRVLLLYAYNLALPATALAGNAFRKHLIERSAQPVIIDGDFLDLARVSDPEYELRTAKFIHDKYASTPPDVVVTMGGAAFPFALKFRDLIAPKAPIVFTNISRSTYKTLHPPADVTGVLLDLGPGLENTLKLAERLQPDARRLYLIAGDGTIDRLWQRIARKVVEKHDRKFDTHYLFDLPYDQLLREVSKIPRDSIVINLTIFSAGASVSIVPGEVVITIANTSPAPLYSPYSIGIGQGVLGGYSASFEEIGIAAADLAHEILTGQDPASLPPRDSPGQAYRVDYKRLRHFNLNERDLPPGTIVMFKKPTLWDQHRELVLTTLIVIGTLTTLIGILLVQRRRRKVAEALLKESEERMTFTAASVNAALWQYDPEIDELWATEHCRILFGLPEDVPLTRETFFNAIHPDDREPAVSLLREMRAGDASATQDLRILRPDGEIRWISVRARSQPKDDGARNYLSGIFVDVTEQKAAETEVALQRREVAHLMRVSMLGELSGAIAHEINQPLTAILSNAHAALDMVPSNTAEFSELRETLQDIIQEDNRASEVINRLRNLLKKGAKTSDTFDVNEMINATVGLLNSEIIGRKIQLKLELASNLPPVSGDFIQNQQVLLNLVMNAMDAMANTPAAQRILTISSRAAAKTIAEIIVKDRGPGIGEAAQARVFEPFYSTKENGLGLGLAICSTIIEAHGGTLTLVDDKNGGAIASFSLPTVTSYPA